MCFEVGDKVRVVAERPSRRNRPKYICWLGREGIVVNHRGFNRVLNTVRFENGVCETCGHNDRKYVDFTDDEIALVDETVTIEAKHLRKRIDELVAEARKIEERLNEIGSSVAL